MPFLEGYYVFIFVYVFIKWKLPPKGTSQHFTNKVNYFYSSPVKFCLNKSISKPFQTASVLFSVLVIITQCQVVKLKGGVEKFE